MFGIFNRRKSLKRYLKKSKFSYIEIYSCKYVEEEQLDDGLYCSNKLLNENADLIGKIYRGEDDINHLKKMFSRKIKNEIFSLCKPVYRDAIVFVGEDNEIKGVIYICFQCLSIINEKWEFFEADIKMYNEIGDFLNNYKEKCH